MLYDDLFVLYHLAVLLLSQPSTTPFSSMLFHSLEVHMRVVLKDLC